MVHPDDDVLAFAQFALEPQTAGRLTTVRLSSFIHLGGDGATVRLDAQLGSVFGRALRILRQISPKLADMIGAHYDPQTRMYVAPRSSFFMLNVFAVCVLDKCETALSLGGTTVRRHAETQTITPAELRTLKNELLEQRVMEQHDVDAGARRSRRRQRDK